MCYSVSWRLWRWALLAGNVGRVDAPDTGGDALCATLCMLEAVEFSKFAGVLEVLDASEVMRCVVLYMPEGVEGEVRR